MGGKALDARVFFRWFSHGVVQGTIIYYLTVDMLGVHHMHPEDGVPDSQVVVGMAGYTCAFIVQLLVVYLEHNRISVLNHALILGTLVLYLVLFTIFSNMPGMTVG